MWNLGITSRDSGQTGILVAQMGKPRHALSFFQANVTPVWAEANVRLTVRMHHPTCLALLPL